jgi:hypothetical protein
VSHSHVVLHLSNESFSR